MIEDLDALGVSSGDADLAAWAPALPGDAALAAWAPPPPGDTVLSALAAWAPEMPGIEGVPGHAEQADLSSL